MRGFLLDTNFVSELVRIKPDPMATGWMADADDTKLNLSVLTLGEIRKGAHDLPDSVRRRGLENWLERGLPAAFCRPSHWHRRCNRGAVGSSFIGNEAAWDSGRNR